MKNTLKNKSFQLWPRAAAGAALICCLNTAQGAAESSSFAYRAAIVSAPEAAWLRLQLPPAALAQVQTLDAQDVQVQDARGQILPVYLAPITQAARAPAQFSMSYPALPYRQTQAASTAGAKLQVRVQSARVTGHRRPDPPLRRPHDYRTTHGGSHRPLRAGSYL